MAHLEEQTEIEFEFDIFQQYLHQSRFVCTQGIGMMVQEEYLKQYMAQVALIQQRQAQARAGHLDVQGQQELKDLKTDLAIAKGMHSMSLQYKMLVVVLSCNYLAYIDGQEFHWPQFWLQ